MKTLRQKLMELSKYCKKRGYFNRQNFQVVNISKDGIKSKGTFKFYFDGDEYNCFYIDDLWEFKTIQDGVAIYNQKGEDIDLEEVRKQINRFKKKVINTNRKVLSQEDIRLERIKRLKAEIKELQNNNNIKKEK